MNDIKPYLWTCACGIVSDARNKVRCERCKCTASDDIQTLALEWHEKQRDIPLFKTPYQRRYIPSLLTRIKQLFMGGYRLPEEESRYKDCASCDKPIDTFNQACETGADGKRYHFECKPKDE